MKYEPTAVDHTVGLDDSVLQSPPILSLWIWLEVNLTCFINVLWPGASIDDPVRQLVLWRINVDGCQCRQGPDCAFDKVD